MSKTKVHTTNYFNVFIEVAEDTKVDRGTIPPSKEPRTIAEMQYEILSKNPYLFTSDEVLFHVFAERQELTESEYKLERAVFFSKGQACFRASPLTKSYGFGIHANEYGKLALYGMETDEYSQLVKDQNLQKYKAMNSSRKKA